MEHKINKEKYQQYLNVQMRKSGGTRGITKKYETRREFIYSKMIELGVLGETILCVGARDASEVEFFEKRGLKTDGIDLLERNKIIKCDMSKMLEHEYIKKQKYDIVFCNEVLEHCLDLEGFIKGLNKVCKKYLICMGPSSQEKEKNIKYDHWDCAVHEFMINVGDEEKHKKDLLETFKEFKIIINETHKKETRIFFIMEKK